MDNKPKPSDSAGDFLSKQSSSALRKFDVEKWTRGPEAGYCV
jgi:hypothetical protein